MLIRHWRVCLGDYNDCDDRMATWFIDPPYSSKSGRLYTYSEIDYGDLGQWCRERTGQKIVCEMEGATWLPFIPFHVAKGLEGPKGKKKIREVVWLDSDRESKGQE